MPRYNLNLRQQKIVRDVVRVLRGDPYKSFFWNRTPDLLQFPDGVEGEPITVTCDDFNTIAASGLFPADSVFKTGGGTFCELPSEAITAVDQNFGYRKRDLVLRSLLELSGGDPSKGVEFDAACQNVGLTRLEVETAVTVLREAKLVHKGVDVYHITAAGVAAAEDPCEEPSKQPMNFHGPVGAVQTGAHARSVVTQNISAGDDSAALLAELAGIVADLITGLRRVFPDEPDALAEAEELQLEIQADDPDPEAVRAKAQSVIRSTLVRLGQTIEFGAKANAVFELAERAKPLYAAMQKWFDSLG